MTISMVYINKNKTEINQNDIGKAKTIVIAQTAHNTIKGIPTKMEKNPSTG